MPGVTQPAAWQLRDALTSLTVDQLKWYAVLFPGGTPQRKPELVSRIEERLRDPSEMGRLWAALSPIEQQVVAEAVHELNGRYDAEVIPAKYPSAAPPNGASYSSCSDYSGRHQQPATAYDVLFVGEDGRLIPADLVRGLRALAPRPAPMVIRGLDSVPSGPTLRGAQEVPSVMLAETERSVFHDLTATLNVVEQGEVRVGATTRQPTLRALRAQLLAGDYLDEEEASYDRADAAIRPFALIVLVQAAGWAVPGSTGGRLELTKTGRALLGKALGANEVREAWRRWLKSDLLDELSRVRAIKGQQSRSARLTKPSVRRDALAAILGACPVGRWVGLDELFRYVRAHRLGPVRVFLADVHRRASAVRETGRMVLLESDDPYLLAELANKSTLRAFVRLAHIGDRPALLLPEAHQARARRELLKLGYALRRP